MKTLVIFNHQPYGGTNVTWNGLHLADQLVEANQEVQIFLMNDSVDMACDVNRRTPSHTPSRKTAFCHERRYGQGGASKGRRPPRQKKLQASLFGSVIKSGVC